MLEFVTENLVWVVITGIVIIMTFIGYLAEKTDFGRKGIEKRELRAKRRAEEKEKAKQEKIEKEIQKEKELAEKRAKKEEKAEEEPKKKKKKDKKEETVEAPVELFVPENSVPIPVEPLINPNTELTNAGQETTEDLSAPLEPPVVPIVPAIENTSVPVEVFNPTVSDTLIVPENPVPITGESEVNQIVESTPVDVSIPENVPVTAEPLTPVEVMKINPTIETDKMPQDISTIIPSDNPLPDISTLQNTLTNDEEISEEDDVWKF